MQRILITEVKHLRVPGAVLRNPDGLSLIQILEFQARDERWFAECLDLDELRDGTSTD